MKKRVTAILGVVALVGILAISGTVFAAEDSDTTVLTGNTVATIDITPPAGISGWNLVLGQNTQSGTLNVKCNTLWNVNVADTDTVNTNGHMAEYDTATSSYVSSGAKLDNPMHVICTAENTDVTLPTAAKVADGDASGQGDNNIGQDFTITFSQTIEYKDKVLSDPNVYRIVVTFVGTTL